MNHPGSWASLINLKISKCAFKPKVKKAPGSATDLPGNWGEHFLWVELGAPEGE